MEVKGESTDTGCGRCVLGPSVIRIDRGCSPATILVERGGGVISRSTPLIRRGLIYFRKGLALGRVYGGMDGNDSRSTNSYFRIAVGTDLKTMLWRL